MDQTTQTALNIAQAALPIAAAAATIASPQNAVAISAVASLTPLAVSMLQNALTLSQAGAMSDAQLTQLFTTVAAGLETVHKDWIAKNEAQTPSTTPAATA